MPPLPQGIHPGHPGFEQHRILSPPETDDPQPGL